MKKTFLMAFNQFLKSKGGVVSVEYVLSMAIAAIIMIGIYDLFIDMSKEILTSFGKWISLFP